MRERIITREIRVSAVLNKKTGLMIAYSDDLKGLVVPGRTPEEIEERLPAAIRELLELAGEHVVSVEAIRETDDLPSDFVRASFVANASLHAPA